MDTLVFTPAAILHLLYQIDELQGKDIVISESLDHSLLLQIGDSTYELKPETETNVEVSATAVETVEDANSRAYDELVDNEIAFEDDPIEAGLIKETLKTLLIGGMVRLGTKMLKG